MLVGAPILNGSGSGRFTGMVIMGKFLTPRQVHRIGAQAQANLSMTPHAGPQDADRLFTKSDPEQTVKQLASRTTTFAPVFCGGAEAAVAAVREAMAAEDPFAIAFLDARMPPGPDGVWAAARIREMDPAIEIVMCTAYSDVDPADIGGIVPPQEKLSYLQKPFHPHEIRQMTISLASKWRAEHRYFPAPVRR